VRVWPGELRVHGSSFGGRVPDGFGSDGRVMLRKFRSLWGKQKGSSSPRRAIMYGILALSLGGSGPTTDFAMG
jgi:hypothetical protein